MAQDELVWMVGGPQGSGVDSAARLFALATARGGLHVVGQREYYSNIKGKHSYYKLRLADRPIQAPVDDVQLLATYENETVCRHLQDRTLVEGGAILYDPSIVDETVADQKFMDKRVKEDIAEDLGRPAVKITIQDLLDRAEKQGVLTFAFPYEELMKDIAEELGIDDHNKLQILKNTMSVAASLGVLHWDMENFYKTLEVVFGGKKESIIQMNKAAARHSASYMQEHFPEFAFSVQPVETDGKRIFLQGTDAVALGKIVAGCRVQTYYPISPATDESVYLEGKPETGVAVIQTEDEISAIDMAVSAALTGARSSTSTSGPGVNLMVEGLGFGGICEVPVVLVNYQRGGPSTGLPTRSEQGDLQFMLNLGNGEFPRLVLTPGDLQEMFHDTVDAFNFAERYQTPVILLSDKDLAGNSSTITPFETDGLIIDRGKLLEGDVGEHDLSREGIFRRFEASEDGISQRVVLGQEGGIHWLTSDEHTEVGHITEDTVKRDRIMEKRMQKLETAAVEIPSERKAALFGPETAEVTILSWGSPKASILEAMEKLNRDGDVVNFLQLRILSPFPLDEVTRALERAELSVTLENNYSGQLADVIRMRTGIKVDHRVVKYNGRPITVDDVLRAVGKAKELEPERIVLRSGV